MAAGGLSYGSSRIRMSRLGHAMAPGQPGEPPLEAAMAAALPAGGKVTRQARSWPRHCPGRAR